MKRSIRRHYAAVNKARHRHILEIVHFAKLNGWSWMIRGELIEIPPSIKAWNNVSRCCMQEPGWWTHEYTIQPARTKSSRLCRLVEKGAIDPDGIVWPDFRKPHVYYW
jgi:hypothetical protein